MQPRLPKESIKINKIGSAKQKDQPQQSDARAAPKRVEEEKRQKNGESIYAPEELKARNPRNNQEYNSRASLRSSSGSTASLKELMIGTTGHFSIN